MLEERFSIMETAGKYTQLVTANGNQQAPVQRWFHIKEAFSLDLMEVLISEWRIPLEAIRRVLDPFCGVGTTLLATQMIARQHARPNLEVIGFERNPFLHFAAKTKSQWHNYNSDRLEAHVAHLMNGAVVPASRPIRPLSTLHRSDIFEPNVFALALAFREAIEKVAADHVESAPLLLGYASILEDISGVRKDGRALRVVPNKQRREFRTALEETWRMMRSDVAIAEQIYFPIKTEVVLGDGRTLSPDDGSVVDVSDIDLILYSPPYLNNIDYTEVYKVELWMCGFITSQDEFRDQRLRTMRSHPSIQFPDRITMEHDARLAEVVGILDQLIEILPRDRYFGERSRGFKGYFDDMYRALSSQLSVLNPGGWAFCVVGNSLHGSKHQPDARIPVASDLLIALIAESLGLSVKGIQIARHLTRRSPGGHYMRESILALRKPS